MMIKTKTKKSGKYSELPLRVASGLVLAGFALGCTWIGGKTFTLCAMVIAGLIFYEFCNMARHNLPKRVAVMAFVFLVMVFAISYLGRPISGAQLLAASAVVLMAWEWVIRKSIWGGLLLLYAGFPFLALSGLRQGENGLFVILFIFFCVWGADSLAYFAGKTFGGPKLAPSISPNKTWSGFLGGLTGSVLISSIPLIYFGYQFALGAIIFALVLSVISQLGDLFESWIKRHFDLKDSGSLIPGHGGILDRIDGLIFAATGAWFVSIFILFTHPVKRPLADGLAELFFSLSR